MWHNLSCFCSLPHSGGYRIVRYGGTYHVSVVNLTLLPAVLLVKALLIMFLWCTSLRWLKYCQMWFYLSRFCDVPRSVVFRFVRFMALPTPFLWCSLVRLLQYCQLWLYLSCCYSVPHSRVYSIVSYGVTYHVFCCLPHYVGCSIVCYGPSYHISAVSSLRWLQYCQLSLYLSCFCDVPHSGGYIIVRCCTTYHVSVVYRTPVAAVQLVMAVPLTVVCLTLSSSDLSVRALIMMFLWCTSPWRLLKYQLWLCLSCISGLPHSGGYSIVRYVRYGATYHVSVVYLTLVATVLSAKALLIMFLWCISLRWLQYCHLWRYISRVCGVLQSGGYSIVATSLW